MSSIVDRLLVLACCLPQLVVNPVDTMTVVTALSAVTVSSLNGYLASKPFRRGSVALYLVVSALHPSLCLCLPLVYYDAFEGFSAWTVLAAAGALAVCLNSLPIHIAISTTALVAVSWALKVRSTAAESRHRELRELRDSTQELTMQLTQKHNELLEKQDYEIRLATLNERSRIAREIHDHVGHLLSRSILQVGALMVTKGDDETRSSLSVIRDTLSQAMDSIRSSVHALYDESFDFRIQVQKLVRDFSFCELRLDYKLESEPDREIAYCLIAVIKEGLNNIIRHSNATLASLKLLEHPALYQLVLWDNGSVVDAAPITPGVRDEGPDMPNRRSEVLGLRSSGLGLRSIEDRVTALGGQFLAQHNGGFRLFVSVPKRRAF